MFEFSHCLPSMSTTSDGLGCFDAVCSEFNRRRQWCGRWASDTSVDLAVPVSFTEAGVNFLAPVTFHQKGQEP